jgi:catechol-2,3-dioxygenase
MSLEPKNSSKPSPLHNRHHNHYPRTMNHVAVSVLDLDKAIRWYTKVLGFNLVKEPMEGISDDTHIGRLFQMFSARDSGN